jgi:serine/threonine protein kinase/Tfp pilus assembly protein PilF
LHPTENELKSFLNESLDENEVSNIDHHLGQCESCQNKLDAMLDTVFSLGSKRDEPSAECSDSTKDLTNDDTVHSNDVLGSSKRLNRLQLGVDNRLVLLGEIARGGMGVIYRGFDRELKRVVAIKILNESADRSLAVRFSREAQISAQLEHPGIVPVHQSGQLPDGRQYIAMKLVKGKTLLEQIHDEHSTINSSQIFETFGQICNAMAYAHSRNIVHRDLKPENVMVGEFGEVQIMDWGLAKKLTEIEDSDESQSKQLDATTTDVPSPADGPSSGKENRFGATAFGQVFGTPAYMPPEQARGEKADKRTDVFAMGGILYQILTGQAPFDAPTATLALAKSIESDLAAAFETIDASEADPKLISIVKSCLAPDVFERPADAEAVNQLFQDFVSRREQQFLENRLERARTTERLIAQQKRSRQITLFSCGIVTALLTTAIAGFLYMSEKSSRASDLAKAEIEQVKRQNAAENQIRVGLSSARQFSKLANDDDTDGDAQHWQAALFELKQAQSIADESSSESLRAELNDATNKIQKSADQFFDLSERQQQDLDCSEQLRHCCYQCLYPPSLRIAIKERLSDQFERAFQIIGVSPGDLSEETISRLAESEEHAFLIHGLLFWKVTIARESRRLERREDDEQRRAWLNELTLKADPHPFRNKIREVLREKEYEKLKPMLKTKESVETLSTVLLCSLLSEFLKDPQDGANYLLRAQQAFPDEFQIKWKLSAVNGLDVEAQKELGLRASLACYSLQPKNPAVLMNLGATYIQQENYELAVELLEQVVEFAPNFVDAQYNLANAYWRHGQPEAAIQTCNKILAIEPDQFWATQLRGLVYEELEQIDKAIADFKKAAAINSKNNTAHYQLYEIYRKRNELEEAEVYLNQAVKIQPKNFGYQKELGALYMKMQKWDLAQATYESILERSPKNTSALASLAKLHVKRNRPQRSESLLRDAIFMGVNHRSIQLELARALLAQGVDDEKSEEKEEGILILEKLVKLVPDMKEPKALLRKYGGPL